MILFEDFEDLLNLNSLGGDVKFFKTVPFLGDLGKLDALTDENDPFLFLLLFLNIGVGCST